MDVENKKFLLKFKNGKKQEKVSFTYFLNTYVVCFFFRNGWITGFTQIIIRKFWDLNFFFFQFQFLFFISRIFFSAASYRGHLQFGLWCDRPTTAVIKKNCLCSVCMGIFSSSDLLLLSHLHRSKKNLWMSHHWFLWCCFFLPLIKQRLVGF